MASFLGFFTVFSLLILCSNSIDARKDLGEYWRDLMNDQPMPEALRGLVPMDTIPSLSSKKTYCHTSLETENIGRLVADIEPRPSVTNYNNVNPTYKKSLRPSTTSYNNNISPEERKSFMKDFEPRPSVTSYNNDINPEEKKSFMKDFEPRPSVTSNSNAISPEEKKSFMKDFEPRPSVTSYNDINPEEKKSFMKDFEPRPSVTSYNNDISPEEKKSFVKDFELRPSVTSYDSL